MALSYGARATSATGGEQRGRTGLDAGAAADEGVLDPEVAAWLEANPMVGTRIEELPPEMLALARGPEGAPPTRPISRDHR